MFDRNRPLTESLTASLSSARSNKQHPVPMWQMPCPTPILLRRALCEGVIAAVFLFNTNTAFTALLHKQSQTWLQNHLLLGGSIISFGKCIYSFRTQGLHAALQGSLCRRTLMLDSVWACFRHMDCPYCIHQDLTLSLKKPHPT